MAPPRKKTSAPRRRRTAEEARREILDAAEQQLGKAGPDSIRLQDVARAVGMSHPTVLHHFGSRDELVRAVVERAFETLSSELVGAFAMVDIDIGERGTERLLDRVAVTLGERGFARLLAWLLLSGKGLPEGAPTSPIRRVAEAAHEHRRRQRGARAGDYEDTLFVTLLVALISFGDAIVGEQLRSNAGLGSDGDAARRFRSWLAKLIVEHVEERQPEVARRPRR
jgi:AcrR family transcriptional regulator